MVYATSVVSWYLYAKKHFTHQAYQGLIEGFKRADMEVDLTGRNFVVTGGNSGIGLACCTQLAKRGATVYLLCRSVSRGREAVQKIVSTTGNSNIHQRSVDLKDFNSVRAFGAEVEGEGLVLHGLINNAGCMINDKECIPQGYDSNLATNVIGTFLLTELLVPGLRRGAPSRVVVVSSGGMLTEQLDLDDMQLRKWKKYDGTRAYAKQKRMQVVLTHVWAEKYAAARISFHSMHPGWADTPAVRASMPGFYEKHKEMLRSADGGADTAVWLAISPAVDAFPSGNFYLDRNIVPEHLTSDTKYDYPVVSRILYDAVYRMAGLNPSITRERVDALHAAMRVPDALPFKTRSQRLTSYKDCCPGDEIVDWVVSTGRASTRDEAVMLCQQLSDEGLLVHVNYEKAFEFGSDLYRLVPPADDPRTVISLAWSKELLAAAEDVSAWTLHSNDTDRSIQAFIKDAPDCGLKITKVVTAMNGTFEAVEDLLHTRMVERHKEWNESFCHGFVISEADEDSNLMVWRYRLGAAVSPREFLVAHRRIRLEDGRVMFVEKSANHPGIPATGTEYVRSNIVFNLRVFSPNPAGGLTCCHMQLTDLGGSMPDWLVNRVGPSMCMDELVHIREAVEKSVGAGPGGAAASAAALRM